MPGTGANTACTVIELEHVLDQETPALVSLASQGKHFVKLPEPPGTHILMFDEQFNNDAKHSLCEKMLGLPPAEIFDPDTWVAKFDLFIKNLEVQKIFFHFEDSVSLLNLAARFNLYIEK